MKVTYSDLKHTRPTTKVSGSVQVSLWGSARDARIVAHRLMARGLELGADDAQMEMMVLGSQVRVYVTLRGTEGRWTEKLSVWVRPGDIAVTLMEQALGDLGIGK
jgi:hypothetical protein